MGRRRRRSRGGLSRRRFLVGGLLGLGGASLLGGTQAFSRVDATRAASVQTADDENALLEIDTPGVVPVGVDDVDLVEVTNNTGDQLTTSVDVMDLRSSESYDTTPRGLSRGESGQFTASLATGRAIDGDAVNVDVMGSNEDLDVQLSRRVPVPSLSYSVADSTADDAVQFDVQYNVRNVPSFDAISIHVDDVSADWGPSESFSSGSPSGVVSFPDNSSAGGTENHDFEITFEVTDSIVGQVLHTTITVTADGNDRGEGDLGDEDDPQLVGFSATNEEQDTNNRFTVDYEVTRPGEFDEVRVVFDNTEQGQDWANATKTSVATPAGTVVYPSEGDYQGGIDGNTYRITVEVYNTAGLRVDFGTVEIDAGSNDSVEYS